MRYGDGVHDTDIQRVIATMLFASRGAALFYYGDEIGMKTTPPTRKEDVKDPIGITGWPKEKGRDGERTPMQWDASAERRLYYRQRRGCRCRPALRQSTWRPSSAIPTRCWPGTEPDPAQEDQSGLRARRQHHARHRKHKVLSWMRQAPGAPQVVV